MINYNGTSPKSHTVLFTAALDGFYSLRVSAACAETPATRTVHVKLYRNAGPIAKFAVSEEFPSAPSPAVVAVDGRGASQRTIDVLLVSGDTLGFSLERYAGGGSTTVPPWSVTFGLERLGDEL